MEFLSHAMKCLSYLKHANPKRFHELNDTIYEAADFLRNLMKHNRSHLRNTKEREEEVQQETVMEELAFIKDTDPWRYKDLIVTIYGAADLARLKEKEPHLYVVKKRQQEAKGGGLNVQT